MKKRIILFVLILAVLAAAILGGRRLLLVSRLKNKELLSASWSVGGGMTGGHSSIEIRRKDEKAIIVTENQEWHNSDLTRTTYTVPADVLAELKELIIKAKVPMLEKRGMSKMIALDADTYHFRCSFDDGKYYSVSQDQKMSSREAQKMMEIRNYLYSLTKGEGTTEIIPGGSQGN